MRSKIKRYYRKVIKVGGGRYLAVGSFTPLSWKNVSVGVLYDGEKVCIVLENLEGKK